jgi:hypothetical protein
VAVSTEDFRYFSNNKTVAKIETELDNEMKLGKLSDDATTTKSRSIIKKI